MLSAKCHLRILALAALCLAAALPALARDWRITRFDSNIVVAPNGTEEVTERIQLQFTGSFRGIYRDIPIEYAGPHGSNYTLFLKVRGIEDADGNKLKYESSRENGSRHIKIYIPNADDAVKTVLIHYFVGNGVRWFEDHDEFYWNVTGNDWPVPIESASASITFPANAGDELRAQAYTGVYGSAEQDATVQVKGNVVRVSGNHPLSMREGLTVDVYITKGVLTEPSKWIRLKWFLRSNVGLLLAPWALVVMFFFWWTKGRDPKPDISVAPMYEPPKGMTPAEVGALVDDVVHPRDITSTVVDLAVKGYLKIQETDSKVLLFTHRDYTFTLLKPEAEWGQLETHERVLLRHMFADGATQATLSDMRNHFYVAIPTMKDNIISELRGKGMYSVDPESARAYVLAGILLTVAPFILIQIFGLASVFDAPVFLIASAAVAVVIIILFARIMSAKSEKGVRTMVEILGFQEFVNRVDSDRLQRMPPDTFEKFLPYAMALGLEHRWAKAFAGIVQNPPTWYAGPTPYGVFNPIFFAGAMHNMAMDTHQAFVASPRASSTGSGWGGGGGGGFSGGGFGGGGGGAF